MARNEDGLALHRSHAHLRGLGVAVRADVGGIEQLHDLEIHFPTLERRGGQLVRARAVLGQQIEHLMEKRVDLVVFLAEYLGMVCVRCRPLQAVGEQFLQAGDIVAQGFFSLCNADLLALCDESIQVAGRRPCGGAVERFGFAAGLLAGILVEHLGAVAHFRSFQNQSLKPRGVEVDVRHRGEQRFAGEHVDLRVFRPQRSRSVCVHGQSFGRVQQEILQRRGLRIFAANASLGASRALSSLFALITKH